MINFLKDFRNRLIMQSLSFLLLDSFSLLFWFKLHFILADLLAFCYIFLKLYRILCFIKLTFDQLPLFNPYYWPLSAIRILTNPYFQFCSKIVPTLRFGRYSYNASVLIALEMLMAFITIVIRLRFFILNHAQNIVIS